MKEKDKSAIQEERFNKRNEQLLDFYDAPPDGLTEAEESYLLPILNTLQSDEERYEEQAFIAEGSEKRITRVYDHRLKRHIAMARATRAEKPYDYEQFLREAQLEANLMHPYIVPVYNMGVDSDGIPYFTMELIPGDSLQDILRKLHKGNQEYLRKYPLEKLLNMFLKICDAIAYAHSRNVLHLDIKPGNIRVGQFGEIFIFDWGLAQIIFTENPAADNLPDNASSTDTSDKLDGDLLNDITQTGFIKGTPGFMAPEQAEAAGHKTVQTDIYSLGALLYMLMTGDLPVQGESGNEILENTRNGRIIPPHLRAKNRILPKSLTAVAMKALSFKPENRYESVTDLQEEISRFLSGFPTTAERAGIITSLSLLMKRHNRMTTLIMLFLLLLAVVISINMVNLNRQKALAITARKEAEDNLRLYREQQQTAQKLDSQLTLSTDYALTSEDFSKAKEMILALQVGLEQTTDPEQRNLLLEKKGILHFVLQQFKKALICFDQLETISPSTEDTILLCRKVATIERKALTVDHMIELVEEAKYANKHIYYLYHHFMLRKNNITPEKYLPLAKIMLDKINKINPTHTNTETLKLEQRKNGYHLDLSDSPYLTYTLSGVGLTRTNILSPFNLTSLDISHLPLLTLGEFQNLKIEELNITGIKTRRTTILLKHLHQMGVRRVTMTTDDYPPHFIKELRASIAVTDSDSSTD